MSEINESETNEPAAAEAPVAQSAVAEAGAATSPAASSNDSTTEGATSIEDVIIEQLQTIYDPEIPVDIHKLGLIYGVEVSEEGDAKVTMTLTAPNCPAAQSLPEEVKQKTEAVEGVRSAEVDVVFEPPWTVEKMDDAAKLVLNIL